MVIVDVYGDTAMPFSLVTQQYTQALAELVAPTGHVVVNVVAGTEGPCRAVFTAIDAAYRHMFPFAIYNQQPGGSSKRTNYIVMYGRSPVTELGFTPLPSFSGQMYDDNYMPAERLYYGCEAYRD